MNKYNEDSWKEGYRKGYQDGLKDGNSNIKYCPTPFTPYPSQPYPPNDIIKTYNHCSKCTVNFDWAMGYVCPNLDCPKI